jgi:hypothetical protein
MCVVEGGWGCCRDKCSKTGRDYAVPVKKSSLFRKVFVEEREGLLLR